MNYMKTTLHLIFSENLLATCESRFEGHIDDLWSQQETASPNVEVTIVLACNTRR
jgi:hypothetical protein